MIRLLTLLVFGTSTLITTAQNDPVRIALVGTVHFEPSEVDLYANEELDVQSGLRQEQLDQVAQQIAAFGADRICIEYSSASQQETDSLLREYKAGRYKLDKNEVEQLGFRAAARCELNQLTCINHRGTFYGDSVFAFAAENGQDSIIAQVQALGASFINEANEQLKTTSITEFLLYINSVEALRRNASFYTMLLAAIGTNENQIGTSLVAEWYKTNLHIYTNLLQSIHRNDKEVVVIFGQGHIPILQHLISTNPNFELVAIDELLN